MAADASDASFSATRLIDERYAPVRRLQRALQWAAPCPSNIWLPRQLYWHCAVLRANARARLLDAGRPHGLALEHRVIAPARSRRWCSSRRIRVGSVRFSRETAQGSYRLRIGDEIEATQRQTPRAAIFGCARSTRSR